MARGGGRLLYTLLTKSYNHVFSCQNPAKLGGSGGGAV